MFGNKNFPQLKFCLDTITDKDTGDYFSKLLINNNVIDDYYIWNDCLYFSVDDEHKMHFCSLVVWFTNFLEMAMVNKTHFELKSNDITDSKLKYVYSYNLTVSNGSVYSSLTFPGLCPDPIYFNKYINDDFIRRDILMEGSLNATTKDIIYIEDKLDDYKKFVSFMNNKKIVN